MKYQIIKHNKTGSKKLAMVNTMAEAKEFVKNIDTKNLGMLFNGLSYIGQFPTFVDNKNKIYSIQGSVDGLGIVCSLPKEDLAEYQHA